MAILASLAVILGIISFLFFDVPTKWKEWRYGVYLTPKKIISVPSDWVMTKNLQVVNNNPYPIYAVELRISEKNNSENLNKVRTKVSKEEHAIQMPNKVLFPVDLNAFEIFGKNKNGESWRRLVVYKINPRSHMDIEIELPATKDLNKFDIKLTYFSKEASPIRKNDNSVAIQFQIHD